VKEVDHTESGISLKSIHFSSAAGSICSYYKQRIGKGNGRSPCSHLLEICCFGNNDLENFTFSGKYFTIFVSNDVVPNYLLIYEVN